MSDRGVKDFLDDLTRGPRDVRLLSDRHQHVHDVGGLDFVKLMLVKGCANDLHDALELGSCGPVPHASLVGLPPFLGELSKYARPSGAALLFLAVFFRIDSFEKSRGVDCLVSGIGKLQACFLRRTETHLLHDAVALIAEGQAPVKRSDRDCCRMGIRPGQRRDSFWLSLAAFELEAVWEIRTPVPRRVSNCRTKILRNLIFFFTSRFEGLVEGHRERDLKSPDWNTLDTDLWTLQMSLFST